jgi:ankyrin repeat protein
VRGILEELPETLDETYERVLRDINKANRQHAHRLLQCLTVAIRPLRVEELAEVLAVDFDAARQEGIPKLNLDWRWADQHQAVLSTCSSLIAIVDDGNSQVVQFSHFSVKEFLTSGRLVLSGGDVSHYHILLEPAHTILAQACLGVLLHLDDRVNRGNAKDTPLAEYAARHWVDHAQFGKVSSHIQDAMEFFFDADKPHWTAWIRVYNMDEYWEWLSPDGPVHANFPLYYASFCGFYDLAKLLIGRHPEHINSRGGLLVTPLVAALYRKHFEVAELLHQHRADLNVRGYEEGTPLSVACSDGRVDIVYWLLDHGADVDARKSSRSTSLHLAAFNGHLKAARALLDHGADVNARGYDGIPPLHAAIVTRCPDAQLDIMQLLLEYGADANAKDDAESTPLHCSSGSRKQSRLYVGMGTVEVMRLLLKHGANIHAEDNRGRTPLQMALLYGHDEMAGFLSEHGAR